MHTVYLQVQVRPRAEADVARVAEPLPAAHARLRPPPDRSASDAGGLQVTFRLGSFQICVRTLGFLILLAESGC